MKLKRLMKQKPIMTLVHWLLLIKMIMKQNTCIVDNGLILPSPDKHFLAETAPYAVHESTSLIKDPDGEGGTRK